MPETPPVAYSDDLVTLFAGDNREQEEWLTADVLVTDPPYGIDYRSGEMYINKKAQAKAESRGKLRTVVGDSDTAIRDDVLNRWGSRPAAVFGSWKMPRPAGTKYRLIWDKLGRHPGLNTAPWFPTDEEIYILGDGWGGKPFRTVIHTREQRSGKYGHSARYGHPTSKPINLLQQLIDKAPAGTIADPFAGSGTTLIAARSRGRRAIGVEVDPTYIKAAVRNLTLSERTK